MVRTRSRTQLVAAVTVLAVWLSTPSTSFCSAPLRSSRSARLPRRASGGDEVQKRAVVVPPEVNYFTNLEIIDCLKEGCSVDALEDNIDKLARDEKRIQDALDALRPVQQEVHSADMAETMGWFRSFLDNSRLLRQELQNIRGLRHATTNFAKQFVNLGRHHGGHDGKEGTFGGAGPGHLGTAPTKAHHHH